MPLLSPGQAQRALLERLNQERVDRDKQEQYLAECFDLQLAVINDESEKISVRCGRRSGKTSALARRLIKKAQKHRRAKCAYFALSKPHAIRLMWDPLQDINRKFKVGLDFNQQKHEAYLPGGGEIWLMGADDKEEREKARGLAFEEVQYDEAGSFGIYLQYLREDVLESALGDYGGSEVMAGTPNPSASGAFFDFDHNPAVSHHHWNVSKNPMFPRWTGDPDWEAKALAYIEGQRRKLPPAKFQRETLGLWVRDQLALLYDIDRTRNVFDVLPADQTFTYVIGCDTGWRDCSALVVLACSNETNSVFQVDSFSKAGIHIDEFAAVIKKYRDLYRPRAIVIDPANKQMVEFMRSRFALGMLDAEKQGKRTFIDFLNSALYQGTFKFIVGSPVMTQMEVLEWNKDRTREAEGPPADLADATLYAYRYAFNYLNARELEQEPSREERLREYHEKQAAEIKARRMNTLNRRDPLDHPNLEETDDRPVRDD